MLAIGIIVWLFLLRSILLRHLRMLLLLWWRRLPVHLQICQSIFSEMVDLKASLCLGTCAPVSKRDE